MEVQMNLLGTVILVVLSTIYVIWMAGAVSDVRCTTSICATNIEYRDWKILKGNTFQFFIETGAILVASAIMAGAWIYIPHF